MRHLQLTLLPFLALGLAACGSRGGGGGTDLGTGTDGSSMMDAGTDGGGDVDAGTDSGLHDLGQPDLGEPCGPGLFCGNGSYCCNTCCLPNTMPICLARSCDTVDGGPRPDGGPTPDGGPITDGGPFDGGHTGATCGGFGGIRCARGEFCNYTLADMCGFTDATGTCEPVPSPGTCSGGTDPVCGCDGVDYDSECLANASGVAVQSHGSCGIDPPPPPPPPRDAGVGGTDCRSTGCPTGESCDLCWTSWLCLPPGTAC